MSDIYLSITETPTVVTLTNPLISSNVAQSVTVTNVVSVNVVTMPAITVQAAAPAVTTVAGTVTANVFGLLKSDEGPSGDGVQIYGYDGISDHARMLRTSENYPSVLAVDPVSIPPISGTVTVSNSVTIGSLPAISGTVTANISAIYEGESFFEQADNPMMAVGGLLVSESGSSLNEIRPITIDNNTGSQNVAVKNSVTIGSLPAISGTVTANAILQNANAMAQAFIDESDGYGAVGVSIVNAAQSLSVFGAVTAAAPNGSLTTRFGTPTTANTAFATSAVTNANRKYLLIQNVTTGSNVITVGIGFTPTTTQGIQLTAGAGITFESSYIPTGAVQILSSVTASNFTILEA